MLSAVLAIAVQQGDVGARLLWPQVSSRQILRYSRTDRAMAPFNHITEGHIKVEISAANSAQINWVETLVHPGNGSSQTDPPFQLFSSGLMTEGGGVADARIRPFYNPYLLGTLPATFHVGSSWTVRYADRNNEFVSPGNATVHVSHVDTAAQRVDFSIDFDGSSNRQFSNVMAGGVVSMDIRKRAHATAVFIKGILSSWKESGTMLERTADSPTHALNYDVTEVLVNQDKS